MIIGISGKIGSGKDELFNIFQTLSNYAFTNKKFAGKLKDIACLLLGCTREQLEDREFKEKELGEEWWVYNVWKGGEMTGDFQESIISYNSKHLLKKWEDNCIIKLTPRKLLQLLGTEAGREIIHPNIWVNALMNECELKEVIEPISEKNKAKYKVGFVPTHQVSMRYPNWIITDMRFPNEMEAIKDKGGITIRINRPQLIERDFEHFSETALDNHNFDYVIDNNGSISDLIDKVKQLKLV